MSATASSCPVLPADESDNWYPASWRRFPAAQQPVYPEQGALAEAQRQLARLPPLVTSREVIKLKQQLAEAQEGKRFILQGGDCAESYAECAPGIISNQLKVLLQMSVLLMHGMRMPVVKVGRFAGQYAKPRSTNTETHDGVTHPVYRGDLVNSAEFTAHGRSADPARMLKGHAHSAMTLNFVRALCDGGFTDLHHPEYWDLSWVEHSPASDQYLRIAASVGEAVRFVETISGESLHSINRADFYTSHEALLLPYEEALTRQVPRQDGWFNLGTHFPWIGLRTAALDGAHVEYFRGLRNPIAVKIGPLVSSEQLLRLVAALNPGNEPGRLTLIHRMGADKIEQALPALVHSMQREGHRILWICDPMHGNTESTSNGYKTRRFGRIQQELERGFDIHAALGSRLGGVHLELTGEKVTECLGGARGLMETDLPRAYRSNVDPRLNYEQSIELAMLIVQKNAELSGLATTSSAFHH
jgi:3-deoxy-7-phosphoheptulonate synthase